MMNAWMNNTTLKKIRDRVVLVATQLVDALRTQYQKLDKRHRLALAVVPGVLVFLLIITMLNDARDNTKKPTPTKPVAIHFATVPHHVTLQRQSVPLVRRAQHDRAPWTSAVKQLTANTDRHYAMLHTQLQTMQTRIDALLASQQSITAWQHTLPQPNSVLLHKLDRVTQAVQALITQTASTTWVDPKTVEQYFRLVAIQGFSDGMRAIVDVDGNQTTLSLHEHCPACRGWVLQTMDFANQSAVFTKHAHHQQFYVRLHVN